MHSEIENIRESTRKIVQYLGYMNNMFSHIGSISQCFALQKIEKKPMTILELSRELSLEHSSTSRVAKELVSNGYCHYSENPNDRRSRYLSLTSLGKKKVQEIHKIATEQVEKALSQLTTTQKKTVSEGMRLYAKSLEQDHRKHTDEANQM